AGEDVVRREGADAFAQVGAGGLAGLLGLGGDKGGGRDKGGEQATPTREELVTLTADDLPPLLDHPEEFFGLYL
ncbi:hypothetical protein AB0C69_32010, partial [Actinomadura sp. NPDC048032]|uniref:hypothetical protein n=1 Tax=Actinomadura sp. NPDC048032 TaxID=3155747 RepID=UPI0033E38A2E